MLWLRRQGRNSRQGCAVYRACRQGPPPVRRQNRHLIEGNPRVERIIAVVKVGRDEVLPQAGSDQCRAIYPVPGSAPGRSSPEKQHQRSTVFFRAIE
jgi:hypothetical protein